MLEKFNLEEVLADIERDENSATHSVPSLVSQDDIAALLQNRETATGDSEETDAS